MAAVINTRRRQLMTAIGGGLKELVEGYVSGRYGCNFECSCMQLGALMKKLKSLNFSDHGPPDAPFGDLSLVDVVQKLRTIESPTWAASSKKCCDQYKRDKLGVRGCYDKHKPHECSERMPPGLVFREVHLGVGERITTFATDGPLSQHAKRIVWTLEGELTMDLEKFL